MSRKRMKTSDLGLNYEQAAHGVQSAIRFEMSQQGFADHEVDKIINLLKHLRVGIDMRAADQLGLAELLIIKGVFTRDEYIEYMRLAANEELVRYEAHCRKTYGLPDETNFR